MPDRATLTVGMKQVLCTEFGGGIAVSPKATNSLAGGNATGFGHHLFSDPVRVEFTAIFDPFRVESSFV